MAVAISACFMAKTSDGVSRKRVVRTKKADPAKLTISRRRDGSSSLFSKGPVAFVGLADVLILALLLVAPSTYLPMAFLVGILLAAAVGGLSWALWTGKLHWRSLLEANEFRATKKKGGGLSFHGAGPVAYALGAVIPVFLYYVLAPLYVWALWTGFGVGILIAVATMVLISRSKASSDVDEETVAET